MASLLANASSPRPCAMPFMPARVLLGGVLVSVSFAVLSPQPAQANDFHHLWFPHHPLGR